MKNFRGRNVFDAVWLHRPDQLGYFAIRDRTGTPGSTRLALLSPFTS